jgi:hypothetical protein
LERCAEELDGEHCVPGRAGGDDVFAEHAAPRSAPLLALICAPALAAIGLATAPLALAAHISRWRLRCCFGALTWAWIVIASLLFRIGPTLAFADHPQHGAATATQVFNALVDPTSIAAAALFAAAACAIGPLLRTRHLPVALLAALLWGACVDGALRGLDLTQISPSPLVPVGAAACLAIMRAWPGARPREAQAPALG